LIQVKAPATPQAQHDAIEKCAERAMPDTFLHEQTYLLPVEDAGFLLRDALRDVPCRGADCARARPKFEMTEEVAMQRNAMVALAGLALGLSACVAAPPPPQAFVQNCQQFTQDITVAGKSVTGYGV
jgi:hypothetical protein